MKQIKKLAIPFILASIVMLLAACQTIEDYPAASETPVPAASTAENESVDENPTATPITAEVVDWEIEVVAEGLYVPWSIVFTDENRILVSERNGLLREIVDGDLKDRPLYQFEDVAAVDEAGLMGLALDPDYRNNAYIYACYTYREGNTLLNRVVRLVDDPEQPILDGIVIDQIPSAYYHAGCRLRFAADGTLFITAGDALQPSSAQDLDSLAGKILRVNPDGSIPQDNPYPNSPVYSFGHRNPQGLDCDPRTGLLYATEHGPSGSDGPPGGDEINLIEAGGNYGWPLVSHEEEGEGLISPLIVFTPAEAPGSGMFYSGKIFPQYKNDFFVGALRGAGLLRVVISGEDPRLILTVEKIISTVGRMRDVVEGPDGFIYFSTSNLDGRGTASMGDDKIYRLVPLNQ